MTPEDYQLAKELFHELAPLDADQRRHRLDALDVSPSIKQEVHALLSTTSFGPFEETKIGRIGGQLIEEETGSLLDLKSIGSYEILRKLGEGGMGVVFLARREDSSQAVALKVIRPEIGSSDALRRFRREAELLRRLRHPGIAAFYDAGEAEAVMPGGVRAQLPFLAMEYIEGQALLEFAQQQTMSDHDRLRLMAQICGILHYAHEQGIVHRDLKPANILVVSEGSKGLSVGPKVLDFGVARIANPDSATMTRTEAGALMGTLPYMSPEQVAGNIETLDRRSDVYSLAVMLFELLSGQLPYAVRGRPLLDVVRIIQTEDPPPLSALIGGLSKDADAVMAQALEKDPARRYPTAEALADDLEAVIKGRAVMARAPGVVRRVRKWSARHPALGAALSVGFVALVALSWLTLQAVSARKDADRNAQTAEQNARQAQNKATEAQVAQALAEDRGQALAEERQSLLRLSDLRSLQDLEREETELWPAFPDMVPALEQWLARAESLQENLTIHEAVLDELRREESPRAQALSATERRWWSTTLTALTTGLRELATTAEGVEQRLRSAKTIRQRTIEDPADLWEEVIDYAADPDGPYRGLELSPQLGLSPLFEDPDTELLEFWHVESGDQPERDSQSGQFLMTPETGLVFVLVPHQVFLMGSQPDPTQPNFSMYHEDKCGPVHEVELTPYFLSKYEMTRGQWQRAMGTQPSIYARHTTMEDPSRAYPVESITWLSGQQALHRWGLTFPSEAQWECAARSGTSTDWWFGSDPARMASYGNVGDLFAQRARAPQNWAVEPWDDGHYGPAPLGAFPANDFGFHQITGNLREMCLDHYDGGSYSSSERVNPVANFGQFEGAGHTLRDGDFASLAKSSRVFERFSIGESDQANAFFGIRPARVLDP